MVRTELMTTKQQIVAAAIEKVYGPIRSVEFPNKGNRDMTLTAMEQDSGYETTVTIDKFGRIKEN